jgi:hypothetical protein
MSNPPTLPAQAAATRRAATNLAGHVSNLKDLVARGRRPPIELDIALQWLPALTAAADTLEMMAANEAPAEQLV